VWNPTDGRAASQAYGRFMTSISASRHTIDHHVKAVEAARATAVPAIQPPARPERYEQQNARETRKLALVTGAFVLVVLVFFIAMMFILAGHSADPALLTR
jgi:cell division septal protein FtsQ